MTNILKESQLRAMIIMLLEDKSLGEEMIKVNPVVDPSATFTDPGNADYKPNTKRELQIALSAMVADLDDTKVLDVYHSFKQIIDSQEPKEEDTEKQMNNNDVKIEESIRLIVREALNNIKLPRRTLSEYFVKDPATGEMIWKGSGPSPKLSSAATVQKLDPESRGIPQGPDTPAGRAQKKVFKKMNFEDFPDVLAANQPAPGRGRRNKSGDVELKVLASKLGFKNPNGVLQFMNRALEKFKFNYTNFDAISVATLEIMKEYIDELASPYKQNSRTTTGPVISPQDAQFLKQHPEMIEDLETFKVYLNDKLKKRQLVSRNKKFKEQGL